MSNSRPYFGIFGDAVGTLVFHATTFLNAGCQQQSSDFLAPRFVLKAHALELALKSFVLAARLQSIPLADHRAPGHFERVKEYGLKYQETMNDLARKGRYGHDLEKLWAEALRLGYQSDMEPPSWLVILSKLQTGKYELRYPEPATVYELPTLNEVIAIEAEIKRLLEQANSRNRVAS